MSQREATINHCDICTHEWIPKSDVNYTHCTSGKCRSRKWNSGVAQSEEQRGAIVTKVAGSIPAPATKTLSDKGNEQSRLAGARVVGEDQPKTDIETRKALALKTMSDALMKDHEPHQPEPYGEVVPINRCANKDQDLSGDWFRCIKEKGHKGSHLPSAFREEF